VRMPVETALGEETIFPGPSKELQAVSAERAAVATGVIVQQWCFPASFTRRQVVVKTTLAGGVNVNDAVGDGAGPVAGTAGLSVCQTELALME